MKKFSTLKSAQEWIESVEKFGDKYDLIRMENACELLNHPERTFKSIHIGGTNGKGSTLTFLKQILIEAGYNVGTYTSPYIVSFNERITLNNTLISDSDLLHYINEIFDLQATYKEQFNDQITFFELVTLISFLYFKDTKPDIALIEVGLGGLLDATNVITPELSIITTIGFDHMNILGNTLESIARNKLGIVKKNIPLITGITQESLREQFVSHTNKMESSVQFVQDQSIDIVTLSQPTVFVVDGVTYKMPMVGLHQIRNAHVAIRAAQYCRKHLNYSIEDHAMMNGISHARWPGRFEVFGNVVIDGAHNQEGLEACFDTVKQYFPDKKIISLFTVMADKDYQPMLRLIEANTDYVMFTEIPYPRCEKAQTLFEKSQHPNKDYEQDMIKALEKVRPTNDDSLCVVTGSLYFISAIRNYVKKDFE